MTTCLRQPVLSQPKQIPIQLLLYKMSACLMRPVTIFFPKNEKKKTVSNNHYETLPSEEIGNIHKAAMHKK